MLHVNQDVTFTNLTSGLALTNNSNHNIEVQFDEDGNPTEQVVNGAQQNISDAGGGKVLYYHIGHEVVQRRLRHLSADRERDLQWPQQCRHRSLGAV